MPRSAHAPARLLAAAISGIALSACDPVTDPESVATGPAMAEAGGGPAVSSTNPAFGRQGDTQLTVRVLGSGFDQGSTASWERDGVADPAITVHGTQYVSSRELIATISIAPDAQLDFYDVAVYTSSRKKGIGMEMFEVTQAESIGTLGGNTLAREVNDRGQVVGYSYSGSQVHAFLWEAGTGMRSLGAGQAYDIDEAGVTVVGREKVWTWSGAGWTLGVLADQGSWARAVASDAAGIATAIGGSVQAPTGRKGTVERAAKWNRVNGGWTLQPLLALPSGYTSSWAEDINPLGQVVGTVSTGSGDRRATVWESNGSATLLPTATGTTSFAVAINPGGNMVVGISGNAAVFWSRGSGGWSGPVRLESTTCSAMTRAVDVNDAGQIVGQGCTGAMLWSVSEGQVAGQLPLRGFGSPSDNPQAEGINGSGIVAGGAKSVGTVWRF